MRSKLWPVICAWFGVLLLLLISGVSLSEAPRILTICTIQVMSGAFFFNKIWFRRPLSLPEYVGFGFSIGVVLSVVSDQLFLGTFLGPIGWIFPSIIAFIFYLARRPSTPSLKTGLDVDVLRILVTLGIGSLAILGPEWYWPAIPALLFAGAQVIGISESKWRIANFGMPTVALLLRLIGVVMLAVGILVRPVSWWIEDSDFGFFEALTVSFSHWGVSDNPLAAGFTFKYHWLVYAWMGGVTKAGLISDWVMLTRASIVIGVVALLSLVWVIITYFCRSIKTQTIAFFLFCFFDSVPTWGSGFRVGLISSPSQLVGSTWLLAIMAVVIEQKSREVKTSPLLYMILFSGATLSKISHGVVALGALIFMFGLNRMINFKIRQTSYFDVATSFITVAAIYLFFYSGAKNVNLAVAKFPAAIRGELVSYSSSMSLVVAIVFIIGFIGFHLYSLVIGILDKELRTDSIFLFLIGAGASGLILVLTVQASLAAEIYFLHSASILLLVFAASLTANSYETETKLFLSRGRFRFVLMVGIGSALISWWIPNLNSGSKFAISLRISKSLVIAFPILVAFIFALTLSEFRKIKIFLLSGIVGIASMSIGFSGANWFFTLRHEFSSFKQNELVNTGSPDMTDAMKWLRKVSENEDVFASNNSNFLLSTISHRRGYLQSVYLLRRHANLNEVWSEELEARKELQLHAFENPNLTDLINLTRNNVRWYIFDKSEIALPTIFNSIPPNFENDTFALFDLSQMR